MLLHKWGVDLHEEDEDFLAQITQAGEKLASWQQSELRVQQQQLEGSAHLIAEDGEETGIHDT